MDCEYFNNSIVEISKRIYELTSNLAKTLGEVYRELIEHLEKQKEKQIRLKYKPVLNLVKPYSQPYLKVRARARTNI